MTTHADIPEAAVEAACEAEFGMEAYVHMSDEQRERELTYVRNGLVAALPLLLAEKDAEIKRLRKTLTEAEYERDLNGESLMLIRDICKTHGCEAAFADDCVTLLASCLAAARRDEAAIRADEREQIADQIVALEDTLCNPQTCKVLLDLASYIRAGGTPQEDRET